MAVNLSVLILCLWQLASFPSARGQEIAEQKAAVAFVFGTVHSKDRDGKPVAVELPLGTAFFVNYPDARGGSDFAFGYLVTAKHVLKDTDGSFLKEIKLRVNRQGGQGMDFITNIPVSDKNGSLLWFHDADDAVDVAAFPLFPEVKRFEFKQIPISMFADDAFVKAQRVAEGDALYFIGLMVQYYGEKRNYPVVRRGTLALMTDEQIDTPTGRQNAFIAELASWPGNSGSPVFLSLEGLRGGSLQLGTNLRFLGILSGSFLNRFSGNTLDATITAGNELETGISFIIPAAKVKAILDSAPAQANRDMQIPKR